MTRDNERDDSLERFSRDDAPEADPDVVDLSRLASQIPDDEAFAFTGAELERLIARTEAAIDAVETSRVTAIRSIWRRYLPAAAAVFVMVGASVMYTLYDGSAPTPPMVNRNDTLLSDSAAMPTSDEDLSSMMTEINADGLLNGETLSWDELTEDEFNYLNSSLDAMEIL